MFLSLHSIYEPFCGAETAAEICDEEYLMTGLQLAGTHTRAGIFDFKLSANVALMNA